MVREGFHGWATILIAISFLLLVFWMHATYPADTADLESLFWKVVALAGACYLGAMAWGGGRD